MCAPPWLMPALTGGSRTRTRVPDEGGAAHPWRSENFRGSRVWAMCERSRHTACQESWLT